jgi:hypothetical protein
MPTEEEIHEFKKRAVNFANSFNFKGCMIIQDSADFDGVSVYLDCKDIDSLSKIITAFIAALEGKIGKRVHLSFDDSDVNNLTGEVIGHG